MGMVNFFPGESREEGRRGEGYKRRRGWNG